MVLRKSTSQWSVSPETIMSHHYKLVKGMKPRIDMGPPFSMYNSPISVHYIPRRAASADAAKRPLSRPHRELTEFIERTNPSDFKLALNFRNSLYDFVKPRLLNDRNYQPPVHRKLASQKPPLPPEATKSLPKKKPLVPRRKTNEEILFKDAVYSNLIERGVYSDKFIIEITQIEMENWIGRLPWVHLEKLADEIYDELGVAMEQQNKRSGDLSEYLKNSLTLNDDNLAHSRRNSAIERHSVRSTGSSTPSSSSGESSSSASNSEGSSTASHSSSSASSGNSKSSMHSRKSSSSGLSELQF